MTVCKPFVRLADFDGGSIDVFDCLSVGFVGRVFAENGSVDELYGVAGVGCDEFIGVCSELLEEDLLVALFRQLGLLWLLERL